METFGDRVREARKKRGMTQKQLAAASGLSQTTISDIERGRNASSADIVALARAVGVSAEWLADGRGPRALLTPDLPPAEGMNAAALAAAQGGHEGGTLLTGLSPAPDRKGRVPLISNVQAGHWTHAADLLQPGEAYDWIETGVTVRPHTFALRVTGDSMEPEFAHGTIVIVEPEMDAHPGDYVIAKAIDGRNRLCDIYPIASLPVQRISDTRHSTGERDSRAGTCGQRNPIPGANHERTNPARPLHVRGDGLPELRPRSGLCALRRRV